MEVSRAMKDKEKTCVLIVEDDESWQNTLRELLKPLNVGLEIAPDLAKGLEISEKHSSGSEEPIKLVILDMRFPTSTGDKIDERNGLNFLNIDNLYDFLDRSTPVIIFTAFEDYDDCVSAIKSGAYYYLPKKDPKGIKNNSQRLLDMCRMLLFPEKEEGMELDKKGSPNQEWFDEHHLEIRNKYPGKYVVFLPVEIAAARDEPSISFQELKGFRILASGSYETLRRYIFGHPPVRELMPIIVYVEGEPS